MSVGVREENQDTDQFEVREFGIRFIPSANSLQARESSIPPHPRVKSGQIRSYVFASWCIICFFKHGSENKEG